MGRTYFRVLAIFRLIFGLITTLPSHDATVYDAGRC